MHSQTLMLIGGTSNGDHDWLLRHEGKDTGVSWACPKHARVGDDVLIYISAPISQVIATAKVIHEAIPGSEVGKKWRYVAKIGPIKLLPSPIAFSELRRLCPKWAWLRFPRAYAYVPDREAKTLSRRARRIMPPEPTRALPGAGFGDPDTNRKVERASVRAVTRHFREQGFAVTSREKECLGYDLDATKGKLRLHIEVKGVSGIALAFPITAGEVNCAKRDKRFRLAVVTGALAQHRKVHLFTAGAFMRRFRLRGISFLATQKANGTA